MSAEAKVLDASALLALLFGEAGADQVEGQVGSAAISTVNLSEVLARFVRDGHDPAPVAARLEREGLEIVPFSARHADLAARLLPACQPLGLSLGDRACLALAAERDATAITADRAWLDLHVGLRVHSIR